MCASFKYRNGPFHVDHLQTSLPYLPAHLPHLPPLFLPHPVEGSLGGELIRKALDLTSGTAAVKLVRKWEEAGRIGAESQVVPGIEMAVQRYLDGKQNKKLAESTIYKLRNIFEKQLLGWAKNKGYRYLRELTGASLRLADDLEGCAPRRIEEVSKGGWVLLLLHSHEVDRREPDEGHRRSESEAIPHASLRRGGGQRDRFGV
jgi:hypothetical protein